MAKKKFYRPIFYWFLMAARGFFYLLPFEAGFAFAGLMGKLSFYLIAKERRKTISHLKLAFGDEKSDRELMELGAQIFQNYGYVTAEVNLIDKLLPRLDGLITVSGREHIERALARKKGIVAVGAHFGNWEMMAGYLSWKWYPGSALAKRIYYDKYNDILLGLRERFKLKTIYRESPTAAREVFKALKENRVVGFVADQDVGTIGGVFVDFFGRPAYSPAAPVKFAMKTGAPLIALFMVRQGMRHHIFIEPPIELTVTGDEEKDTVVNTQKWVTLQEKYIRQHPHLWGWNHKRWKTRPPEPKKAAN